MCLHCLYVSWLSLSSNSGSVEMWKYVFIVLIYLVTLEVWKIMWKCGNVEICLHRLNLSSNSGSVEMWKDVFIVLIYLVTLEAWKCGNMSSMSLSNNSESVEMWKCENVPPLSSSINTGSVEMWRNVSSLSLCNKEDIFPHFHTSRVIR